ncbi:hypothetical protein EI94DRAFT_1806940 [Lactarius quietus]|nr:hypothetical protein EI94DRAFT_1806940 [Lactarius quietus]
MTSPFDLSKASVLALHNGLTVAGRSSVSTLAFLKMFSGWLELFRMASSATGVTPKSDTEVNVLLQDVCAIHHPFTTNGWIELAPFVLRDDTDRLCREGVMRWVTPSLPLPLPSFTVSNAFSGDAIGQLLELSKRVGAGTLSQADFDKSVPSPVTRATSVTVASSSPAASVAAPSLSELPLCQVQPSPSEARASTILSTVSPTMPPLQPTRVKSPKCLPQMVAVAATATMKELSPVACSSVKQARSPNIIEVIQPPTDASRPVVKKVKCKQEPGQLASAPCVWCKMRGVACVQSKKAGHHKRAPRTPATSTAAMSIATESSHDTSHFDLAWDLDGPILDLITGGSVTATKAESSTVCFWHYKAEKSCWLRVMVAARDDWIQDIYLKSLDWAIYNATAEPLAKRACTAISDPTGKGKGKGRASTNAMDKEEVVELASDGSKDKEEANE